MVRAMASCTRFWASPDRPEQMLNTITVTSRAFLRPKRSATAPKRMPPKEDANRVTVTMKPAVAGFRCHSSMIVFRQKT